MNLKFISKSIFIMFLFFIMASFVFAAIPANHDGNLLATHDGNLQIKPTMYRQNDGNQLEAYDGNLQRPTLYDSNGRGTNERHYESDSKNKFKEGSNSVCINEINKLNLQIRESNNSANGKIRKILQQLKNNRKQIIKLQHQFRECISENKDSGNLMSGDVVFNSKLSEDGNIEDNSLTNELENDSEGTITSNNINTIIAENKNLINSISVRDINGLSQNCVAILDKISSLKLKMSQEVSSLQKLQVENKDNLNNMQDLISKRNQLIRSCYPNTKKLTEECNVPEDLVQLQNNYSNQIDQIKTKLKALDKNSTEFKTGLKQLSNLNKKYVLIFNKVKNIRQACVNNSEDIRNPKNLCESKINLINEKNSLINKLKDANDQSTVYQLNAKLQYLNSQIKLTVCADSNIEDYNVDNRNEKVNVNNLPKNQLNNCVSNLVDNNVSRNEAIKSCSLKLTKEIKNQREEIKQLNEQIRAKQKMIDSLGKKMKEIEREYKTAKTVTQRNNFLQQNSATIKQDTSSKIDDAIVRLQKVITSIGLSDMNDTQKNVIINMLNNRIATLQQSKDSISVTEDVNSFKEGLLNARKSDLNAKRVMVVSALKLNVSQMNDIINKYFANNKDQALLKSQVDSLKSELDTLDMNNIDVQKVNRIRENYNKLKAKLKAYATSEVNAQ